jgi:hypothetical protein
MSGAQKTLFTQRFPATDFSDADLAQALQTHGEVVSMRGRRGAPNIFVMKLATQTREFGPFLLNRTVAESLKQLLDQEGF